MAYPFSSAPFLKTYGLIGYLNWWFTPSNLQNRIQFKHQLIQKIPNWKIRYQNQEASISHSPQLLACWTQINHHRIGLDVELRHRITPQLLSRIEKDLSQLQISPVAYSLIWSIKESSFKTFRNLKTAPKTISQIQIESIKLLKPDVWQFHSSYANQNIIGLAGYWQNHTIAIGRHQ